jgi:hypothetical protein
LAQDVPAGTILTRAMIVEPSDSALWALREEQDHRFLETS